MRVLVMAAAMAVSAGMASASVISTLDEDTIYITVNNSIEEEGAGFGTPAGVVFGQSFTVEEASFLTAFGVEIDNETNVDVVYHAYLYEWDGSHIGSQVADFGEIQTSNAPSIEITGQSGLHVSLAAGEYALLYQAVSGGPAGWGATSCVNSTTSECTDPYAGGSFLFSSDFNDEDDSNSVQNNFFVSQNLDSAFSISLEPVPLGAALPMLATGLLGLGAIGLRRRKS